MTPFAPLARHRILSIMPTFQCTAACQHCGTFSHPGVKTKLDPAVIYDVIDQATANGYSLVVFTGGEPSLAGETLVRGIERATRAGLPTRVVTNAWWAADREAALTLMRLWHNAGLKEVNFSTGDQHIRFVSLVNVLTACRAAAEVGMKNIFVMVETTLQGLVTANSISQESAYQELMRDYPDLRINLTESPWMPTDYRTIVKYPNSMLINADTLAQRGGCNTCLTTTTVQADGRLAACCGLGIRTVPELQLGHVGETSLAEADAKAGDDFLKRWIHVEGPEHILAWAASHDSSIEWENLYAHSCQACLRVYKDEKVRAVIRDHHREKLPDVIFTEYLLHSQKIHVAAQSGNHGPL